MRNEQPSSLSDLPDESESIPRLRADLSGISVDHGDRSARIVIDDIGGRFSRIPSHLWELLVRGKASQEAWHQAAAAGWIHRKRDQTAAQHARVSSILAIRIPLLNIDFLARHLSLGSDWVFAASAVKFWVTMMVTAALFALSQYREVLVTFREMPSFFSSSGAWLTGAIFIGTKLIHELGHAIACRRSGVRCGNLGLIFFCGVPCPYCDVTQLWRHPSSRNRAAVMLAGMYVEGILATLATLVWALADDGPVRLHAMNVMIVCSISTLLFNANPLMRYDGYYVLSDWMGSVNLRSESRRAFTSTISKISRRRRGTVSSMRNRRTVGMVTYYLASSVYRYFVLLAIAAAVFVFADTVGLKLVAAIGILLLIIAMTVKAVKRSAGKGQRSLLGKLFTVGIWVTLVGIGLFVPLPRRTTADDAANATGVFLRANGIIESVHFDIGQTVIAGQELARIRDDQLAVQSLAISGQLKVAAYRTQTAKRQALDDSHSSKQLESLEAVQTALQANLVSLNRHRSNLSTLAPVSGIVLPRQANESLAVDSSQDAGPSLLGRVGMRSEKGAPWCRIAADQRVSVVLRVDAMHRESVFDGKILRGYELQSPTKIRRYRVVSISPATIDQAARFEVLCEPMSDDSEGVGFLSRIGGPCKAVIELPARSIGADMIAFLGELFT
jgi:putative peptide zinc metalloprotease protein